MNKHNIHAFVIRCSESLVSVVAKFAYSQLLECGISALFPAVSTVKNDTSFNLSEKQLLCLATPGKWWIGPTSAMDNYT